MCIRDRSRGKSYEEDQRLEKELFADEKERAEHNMLVDLGRNDLGKICDFGTVEVEKYMSIERYSHVMHIGSTVKGQLRKDKTAVDAIDSVLPAGTLSGAPKLRACQIINCLLYTSPQAGDISAPGGISGCPRSERAGDAFGGTAGENCAYRGPAAQGNTVSV